MIEKYSRSQMEKKVLWKRKFLVCCCKKSKNWIVTHDVNVCIYVQVENVVIGMHGEKEVLRRMKQIKL